MAGPTVIGTPKHGMELVQRTKQTRPAELARYCRAGGLPTADGETVKTERTDAGDQGLLGAEFSKRRVPAAPIVKPELMPDGPLFSTAELYPNVPEELCPGCGRVVGVQKVIRPVPYCLACRYLD